MFAGTTNHLSAQILCGRFFMVFFLALFFRGILFAHLLETSYWPLRAAILAAAFAGQLVQLIGVITVVFAPGSWITPSANHWKRLTIVVVAYIVAFKIASMGPINLIPEEAYYWNYAQHLDLSYLDHPPMVAWLIWISTSLFGKSEFSVRLPALICWTVAAAFMFRLTASVFDRNAAYRCLLLMTVLPFYFGFGFFMTPDTPLLAAWAGCLYLSLRRLDRPKSQRLVGCKYMHGARLTVEIHDIVTGLCHASVICSSTGAPDNGGLALNLISPLSCPR